MDSTDEVLAKHRQYLSDFAQAKGIVVADVYEEVISGESIAARPEMQKLLRAVKRGKYEAVLCMDIDRLGRGGMQDQGVILDAFRESKTLIITPDKTYDLSNEQDEMLTEFKSFMSRQEYKIIRKRMLRGKLQTIDSGGHVGPAPYGYKKCRVGKLPSLEIVPEEAEIVRYIYRRYTQGVGSVTIMDELNAAGSHPRNYHEWTRPSVTRILKNPVYKGAVAWNRVKSNKPGTEAYEDSRTYTANKEDWIIRDGLHKAIIPPDEWERAQAIRSEKQIAPKSRALKNPLAGLLVCANCGRKIQRRITSFNASYEYYLCDKRGCCGATRTDLLESTLLAMLSERLEEIKLKVAANEPPDTSTEETALQTVTAEMEKIDARFSRLYDLLEDGTYDKMTFITRRAGLEERKKDLLRTRDEIQTAIASRKAADLSATAEQLETLLETYDALTIEEKNAALKSMIRKIIYFKEKGAKSADFALEIHLKNF